MKILKTLALFLLITTFSCKESGKEKPSYLPESIGAFNSLTIVIENSLWNGQVGDKLREHFAAPALGLTPEQAKFTITQIPPSVFSGTVKNTRSVVFVQKDTISRGHMKKDLYAIPQQIAVFKGRNNKELIENIDKNAEDFIVKFKALELKESQNRFLKSLNKTKVFEEEFGVSLNIPSVYKLGRKEKNFVWFDRPILNGTMNIIAYSVPMNTFKSDSTFVGDIIKMRDSIGKLYIPGTEVPGKVTYMITERAFAPYVFPTEIGSKKAAEVKGIWEIKNYPMAGPFLTYIINDKENNRKLVLEGFAFAPSAEKRDYMFELEAILKTVRF